MPACARIATVEWQQASRHPCDILGQWQNLDRAKLAGVRHLIPLFHFTSRLDTGNERTKSCARPNRAEIAAPIVGENSIGMRLAWRSFQAAIRCSASSSILHRAATRAFRSRMALDPPIIGDRLRKKATGAESRWSSLLLRREPSKRSRHHGPFLVGWPHCPLTRWFQAEKCAGSAASMSIKGRHVRIEAGLNISRPVEPAMSSG